MQKQNLTIIYGSRTYGGYDFEALPLGAARLIAAEQIDQASDQARASVVGDALRVVEYQMAEDEAKAYQVAGFSGPVPPTVQASVDAAGITPQEAAESILQEAFAWRNALCGIRAARLKGKQAVLQANTHAEAEGLADAAINAIRASVVGVVNA
ncbi:hypothetical protein [Pseudomonas inefficax]|uniref:hypothetical protein n=1 Tax=Pseudomonas inefficax TaxID=2078786 RepID=UPI004046A007